MGTDTAEDVRHRGLELEARVLSQAERYFPNDQLVVVVDRVVFRRGINSLLDENDAD